MSLADLLASGDSIPSFFTKNSPVGTSVTGTIISTDVRQSRSYETGEPETWDNGDPKQTVLIVVQTALRDHAEDDGRRGVYIKWWGDQRKALLDAVKRSGDADVRPGGQFTATYTGDGYQENPRLNPPKQYRYEYVMPSATAGLITPQAQQPAPPAPPPVQAAPAAEEAPPIPSTPATQPVGSGVLNDVQLAALKAMGISPSALIPPPQ